MDYIIPVVASILCFLVAMVVCLEAGRRLAVRRAKRGNEVVGSAAIEGAVFGLLGLLIAFTFSGAATRFDTRRDLIVEEANNIGTAYLRVDMLPASAQPPMRELFRRYLDARLAVYRKLPDVDAAREELKVANGLQKDIWDLAVTSSKQSETTAASMLLLPALNQMIDITTTRTVAAYTHPPAMIYVMLTILAMVCAFMAGYGMSSKTKRPWVHILGFALIMTLALYVIVDMEFPRFGFIRINSFDQVLVDLRASMN